MTWFDFGVPAAALAIAILAFFMVRNGKRPNQQPK